LAVRGLCAKHQVGEGKCKQGFELGNGPVVAQRGGAHLAPLIIDLHQFSGWAEAGAVKPAGMFRSRKPLSTNGGASG
jgi:hypothetical protein